MKSWLFFVVVAAGPVAAQQPPRHSSEDAKILPVLWHQVSAEYRALCYQAYNLATLRVDAIPESEVRTDRLAIVTDLDETVLDNSPSEARLISEGREYNAAGWNDWMGRSLAAAMPGAVDFFRHAAARGFTIFYVSNRDTAAMKVTLRNLEKIGLPQAGPSHLLFYSGDASKESRRRQVSARYRIFMLLGDNLNDFTSAFEHKTIADRFTETDRVRSEWGKRFIVLPNAIYGDWENAIYGYGHLSTAQKDSARRALLRSY